MKHYIGIQLFNDGKVRGKIDIIARTHDDACKIALSHFNHPSAGKDACEDYEVRIGEKDAYDRGFMTEHYEPNTGQPIE